MEKKHKKKHKRSAEEAKELNLKAQNSALKKIISAMSKKDDADQAENTNPKIKNNENTENTF